MSPKSQLYEMWYVPNPSFINQDNKSADILITDLYFKGVLSKHHKLSQGSVYHLCRLDVFVFFVLDH